MPTTKIKTENDNLAKRKAAAIALLNTLKTGDVSVLKKLLTPSYIQHNLSAADGPQGLIEFIGHTSKNNPQIEIVRVIAEGDYVVTHGRYNFGMLFGDGADLVAIDVFRFEGDKIAEHWDNIIPWMPKNPSGRSQIDGPTEIKDYASTQANKEVVFKSQSALAKGDTKTALSLFDPGYIQHNPLAGDGLAGLQKAFAEYTKKGTTFTFGKIHHVIAEGDFVFISSEGKLGKDEIAIFDIFRVANGKLAEHWDVLVPVLDPKYRNPQNPNNKW